MEGAGREEFIREGGDVVAVCVLASFNVARVWGVDACSLLSAGILRVKLDVTASELCVLLIGF